MNYLSRRAIVPADDLTKPGLPNLDNIQGDVYYTFPKESLLGYESFIFFSITDKAQFRKDLDTFRPQITTSRQTVENIKKINDEPSGSNDIVSTQIAFSRTGLTELGVRDKIGDPHFDQGPMARERDLLGDLEKYEDDFESGVIHGVILVTAKTQGTCQTRANSITGTIFSRSIKALRVLEGRVRSDKSEHFGYKMGISQPALEGLCKPHPGQREIKPGVIIMGYPGDVVTDQPDVIQRPSFTKDGTFMVFRKLEQDVYGLEKFIDDNRGSASRDLFGAGLVGRFKNGAPLALTSDPNDSQWTRPDKINNFDYSGDQSVSCPFTAHIRKAGPRNLLPFVSKEYVDSAAIVRAGIPYGNDTSSAEKGQWNGNNEQQRANMQKRGLLFVCYQSCISAGFFRIHTGFANNDFFPVVDPLRKNHGQDSLIGGAYPIVRGKADIPSGGGNFTVNLLNQDEKRYEVSGLVQAVGSVAERPTVEGNADIQGEGEVALKLASSNNQKYEIFGYAKEVPSNAPRKQQFFVKPRAGEYFFVPSISALRSLGASGGGVL